MNRNFSFKSRLVGLIGALVLVVGFTGSASAASFGQVKVGSASVIGASDSYYNSATKKTTVVRAVGTFTNHKASSVKLTTLKLCYSDTSHVAGFMLPIIYHDGGKIAWQASSSRNVASGACTSYTINKTFTASSGKELFYVATKLGYQNLTMISRFMR